MLEEKESSPAAGLPPGEWETLAALTGFKPDPLPGKRSSKTLTQGAEPLEAIAPDADPADPILLDEVEKQIPQQAIPNTDLLDPEDLLESEEDKAVTKPTLWTNPWAKGGFVASIVGVGAAGLGLFLWSVENIKPADKQPEPSQPAQTADKTKVDPAQEQIGNLKTVNALGSQAQALNRQAQMQNGFQPKPQAHPSPAPPTRHPLPEVSPTRTTATANYSSAPYIQAQEPIVLPPVRASVASAPAQTIDPQTVWQQALTTGSYGQMPDESPTTFPDPNTEPLRTPVHPDADVTLVASRPQTTDELSSRTLEDSRYQADVGAILSGKASNFRTVLPGAMATATLQTPIFWAQDLEAEQQLQRFSIRLNDAVPAANGTIALPVGTQLIAQVSSISQSGMVQLAVTHAVVPTPQGGQVVNLPSEAILITGDRGKPILAKLKNSGRRRVARMEVETAVFGALGQVGQLLDRPRNESTTTSPFLSSTSTRNGNTNIVGGVLQGAFGTLTPQVQQRHQQEMQDILNRPKLWIVPAGQPLQVFVNTSFGVAQQ